MLLFDGVLLGYGRPVTLGFGIRAADPTGEG